MSDVIDTNIVELKFDSNEFVNGVNHSIMAVDALKDSLVFDSNSFDSLTKAANNVDFSAVASNIESLSNRFSTFGIVGMTAIQRVTNELMTLGGKLVGLLAKPWKQIITGGTNRAANIGQAQFQLEGLFGKTEEGVAKLNMTMKATSEQIVELTGLTDDVIVAMNAADYAVADTAYGLDSAAKAASVLATSGVDVLHFSEDLKDANGKMRTEMQVALRSISGVAAMANASYDDIAHVFERVSGNGRIMAIDLQSLSARGLNAAATLRDYLNEIGETTNATEADIRDMVSKGKIDFMTFAMAMDDAYGDHAKDANNTFSGAFSNMKFALSKIGADFISPLRSKMIPLFNDLRIAINNVRKALNYKIKIPGIENELSIVEAFTNLITNLTAKAHDFFTVWNGGQTVLEKSMSGFTQFTGVAFQDVKGIYDAVADGAMKDTDAISKLISMATKSGHDMKDVFKTLSETLDKTEDDIYSMCYNGEISFEQFSNAVSATFGNLVQETRINQLAQIFQNVIRVAINLAKVVTTTVGPVIWAFFKMFTGGGVHSVVEATQAFADFTAQLHFSRKTQYQIYTIATKIFTVFKSGIKILSKIISTIIKIALELSPLIDDVLGFIDIIVSIVSYLVDIVIESNLLTSAVTILGKAFRVAGLIIVNVLRIIFALVGPAIKAVGDVFGFLARSIASIDLSFLGAIIDRFEELFGAIANGGIMHTIQTAVGVFFGAISKMFSGLTITFEWFNGFLKNVGVMVSNILDRIITTIKNFKEIVIHVFEQLVTFIEDNGPQKLIALAGQLIGFSLLIRFAQGVRGLGRAFGGLGNILNSNALLNFMNAIKTLARAVLEFSLAMVLVSSIPIEHVEATVYLFRQLAKIIMEFVIVYLAYSVIITRINTKVQADPLVKFMNKLNTSINTFLQAAGRSTMFVALGLTLLSLAASLGFFINAVKELNSIDTSVWETGIYRLTLLIGVLTGFLGVLALATRPVIGGSNIDSINLATSGMMGAALVLVALLVIIKEFKNILLDYDEENINEAQWTMGFGRIISVVALLTAAISLIGLTVKGSGFGMMGSVITMMGFLIVLEAFLFIIRQYGTLISDFKKAGQDLDAALIIISEVVILLTIGISAIGLALSAFGGSSFTALYHKGIKFQNNSAKFFGVMLTIVSFAIVLQSVALVLAVMKFAGIESSMSAMNRVILMMIILMGSMVGALAVIRNVRMGSIVSLSVILLTLASILPVLTLFEPDRLRASADALGGIMLALTGMFWIVSNSEMSIRKGVGVAVSMVFALGIIVTALRTLSELDYISVYASGIALAAVISAFAISFMTISKFRFNIQAIGQMVVMLSVITPYILWLSTITDFDPTKLITITGAISLMLLSLSGAVRLLSVGNVTNVAKTMVMLGIAMGALLTFMSAIVQLSKMVGTDYNNVANLSVTMIALIPMIGALAAIAVLMSKFKATLTGAASFAIIGGVLISLMTVFAIIGTFGNVEGTIRLIEGIKWGLIRLAAFMAVIAVFAGTVGAIFTRFPLGAVAFAAGMNAVGAILTIIAAFIGGIAISATLGDANSTVYLLENLGKTLDAMVPFLLKFGAMCALFGLVSPLILSGSMGFRSVLLTVSLFVGMIAAVAQIGSPENTITVLNGLISAMDRFNEFMSHFMLVLTAIGVVAPLIIVGSMALNTIFNVLVAFTASMAIIGTVGNTSNTLSIMTTLVDSMRELVNVFTIVMLLGVLGPAVLTGMILITSSVGMMLGLSYIIGQIGSIRKAITDGITTIMYTAETMQDATEAMSEIDIPAIAKFILALGLVALTPIHGVAKFAQIASMMALMGASSNYILKGSSTAVEMINELRTAAYLIKDIAKVNTRNFVNMSRDILQAAYNISSLTGMYHVEGMIHGLTDPNMLASLVSAAGVVGWLVAATIRNVLGIHSPGDEGEEEMDYHILGMDSSLTDPSNLNMLVNSGTNLFDKFGGSMDSVASMYGASAGASYAESFSETAWSFLEYSAEGWKDLLNYTGLVDYMGGVGARIKDDEIKALSGNTDARNANANAINAQAEATGRLVDAQHEGYWSPNLTYYEDEVDTEDMPFFENLEKYLEGLKESFNLGEIFDGLDTDLDGIGESADSASKKTSELQKKIDDLMDEYENLWENAKKNANKDLFKGVDDQGDDFLDAIQDIMDQYQDIYKTAVEKTNGMDLFAEVKENEEAIAPETLIKRLEAQADQINEVNTIVSSLSTRIADENFREYISKMGVEDLKYLQSLYNADDIQLSRAEESYKQIIQANQNKIQNELTGSLSQLTGEYTDITTYIATDASTQALVNNLQAQIDQLNLYNETVASLMSRITDMDLRQAIAEKGIEALPELQRLNNMNDTMLRQYESMYHEKIAAEAVSLKNELSAQLSAVMGEPLDISQFYEAYKNGAVELGKLIDGDSATVDAGKTAGKTLSSGVSEGMKDSFSKETAEQAGKDYVESLANGMQDKEVINKLEATVDAIVSMIIEPLQESHEQFKQCGSVSIMGSLFDGIDEARLSIEYTEVIESVAWTFINTINSDRFINKFYDLGRYILEGLAKGIEENAGIVTTVAANVAFKAYNAAKNAVKSNSPSKLFMELGRYMDEGLAIGLREYSATAEDAAGEMALGTLSPVQEAIQQMSGMLDGTIDVNPVITPTLDLSQINSRSAALANMFNGRQIAVQARADERQASMMAQLGDVIAKHPTVTNNTFNQTNNSPKALNKTEIYRQTRNGFSQLVNAIS